MYTQPLAAMYICQLSIYLFIYNFNIYNTNDLW